MRVLVTGCSSGIGAATVDTLLARGHQVAAVVRRDADAERLRQRGSELLSVWQFDVTDADAVHRTVRRVTELGPLHGVVNNAGIAVPGPMEHLPIEEFRRQIEVNLVGQLHVIQAALPALRRTTGRIVNVGSIGDRLAGPLLGAYHTSKFGLVGLTDSLRAELAPWGIPVVLVEPGLVGSAIWQRGVAEGQRIFHQLPEYAQRRYGRQLDRTVADARRHAANGPDGSHVARTIVKALTARRPRPRYLCGLDAHLMAVLAALPARLRYRVTASRDGEIPPEETPSVAGAPEVAASVTDQAPGHWRPEPGE